ncbi:MAG: hypothetical protein HYX68_15105 [Planctomycetes bacterium]|nr:hypothetical protein [Planctomycetota bacterium]
MLDEQIEERLDGLEKKLEDLSARVEEISQEREEVLPLIPEAEYDFVPSVPDKVIARGVAKFAGFVEAPKDLGLSASEWALISSDEESGD